MTDNQKSLLEQCTKYFEDLIGMQLHKFIKSTRKEDKLEETWVFDYDFTTDGTVQMGYYFHDAKGTDHSRNLVFIEHLLFDDENQSIILGSIDETVLKSNMRQAFKRFLNVLYGCVHALDTVDGIKDVTAEVVKDENFRSELAQVLNKYGKDSRYNLPDYMLANYLVGCLRNLGLLQGKQLAEVEEIILENLEEEDSLHNRL